MPVFEQDGLFGFKNDFGYILIDAQYTEFYPFRCGCACVRNTKYEYAYIDIINRPIVYFGKYRWLDPFFTEGYARVKLLDNVHWGMINTLGRIVVIPNLDYIYPLTSKPSPIKAYGNDVIIKGIFEGRKVSCRIGKMDVINLPINFRFKRRRLNLNTPENNITSETPRVKTTRITKYDDYECNYEKPDYEDYIEDAFEGDSDACWNID